MHGLRNAAPGSLHRMALPTRLHVTGHSRTSPGNAVLGSRAQRLTWASAFAQKRAWKWALVACLLVARVIGAEVIPATPVDHFNDYAGMVSQEVARQLNSELTQFERDTS